MTVLNKYKFFYCKFLLKNVFIYNTIMAHDVSQKIIYKPSDLNKILLNETKKIAKN